MALRDRSGYIFKPHERPVMLGSPANPDHPRARQRRYLLIGCLIGLTGGLGNALVVVNLAFAQGTLGLYTNESAWLTAGYYMTNTTANLLLVKYRQQFGLQPFIRHVLAVYGVATLMHLFVHDFWTSVAVRAVSGIAGSGLSTLTVLYLIQGMPAPKRMAGMMIGICLPQLAMPLARALSPRLLDWGDWHMLYWFELGLALAMLAAVKALPLPPSERQKVFEPLDFLTFALLAPGLWLLIAVLTQGQVLWWTERPWLGWALAASFGMIAVALMVEHRRVNPLINTRWLGTYEMVRLMLIAAAIRILLSEQTYGSVGLMTLLGMLNDQMIVLNLIVVVAGLAGLVCALVFLNPNNLARPITLAAMLIAIGAFMDAGATNLTRPANLYLSQALIGFAALLFLAQATVIGIARTLLAGGQNLVSFIVLFGLSQSVGGLIGTSLLSTFQVWREKFHSHELVQNIVMTDPNVVARLQAAGGSIAGVVGDPVLRNAQGAASLARQVAREANVLAFNDVFLLAGILAVVATIVGYLIRWSMQRRGEESPIIQLQRKMAAAAQAATPKESSR